MAVIASFPAEPVKLSNATPAIVQIGDNDKGKAVEFLKGLYARAYGDVATAARGNP